MAFDSCADRREEEDFEQHDFIEACFNPVRRDDLRDKTIVRVGQRSLFCTSFVIDRGPYSGQWAFEALPGWGCNWVPRCDLSDIVRVADEEGHARWLRALSDYCKAP